MTQYCIILSCMFVHFENILKASVHYIFNRFAANWVLFILCEGWDYGKIVILLLSAFRFPTLEEYWNMFVQIKDHLYILCPLGSIISFEVLHLFFNELYSDMEPKCPTYNFKYNCFTFC